MRAHVNDTACDQRLGPYLARQAGCKAPLEAFVERAMVCEVTCSEKRTFSRLQIIALLAAFSDISDVTPLCIIEYGVNYFIKAHARALSCSVHECPHDCSWKKYSVRSNSGTRAKCCSIEAAFDRSNCDPVRGQQDSNKSVSWPRQPKQRAESYENPKLH